MLDEPMAGVNPALTQSLLEHVKALRDDGMTVMFVEHDMDVVHDISDWVVVMAEGRVIAEGTPDQISSQPGRDRRLPRRHHDAPLDRGRGAAAAGGGRSAIEAARDRRRWLTPTSPPRSSSSSRPTTDESLRRPAARRATDLVAGYVPGVDILNGCDLELVNAASSSASSAPTAPASPPS